MMKSALIALLAIASNTNAFVSNSHATFYNKVSSSSTSSLSMATPTEGNGGGVVITGSAGGVGFAYAGEFMERGYDVVICDVKDCSVAARALEQRYPNGGKVYQTKCDVSDAKSVEKLGKFAKEKLGTIGYWINNAGINGGRRALMDVPINQVEMVVKVNLLGILLSTKVAMDIMADQVSVVYWLRIRFMKNSF